MIENSIQNHSCLIFVGFDIFHFRKKEEKSAKTMRA